MYIYIHTYIIYIYIYTHKNIYTIWSDSAMLPQKRELPRFPRPSATSQASFPPISGQKKCGWTPLTCLQDGVNEDAGLPRQGRPTKNLRVFKGSNRFGCPTSRTSTRNNMCLCFRAIWTFCLACSNTQSTMYSFPWQFQQPPTMKDLSI